MSQQNKPLLSRKDIAQRLGFCVRTVTRNEKRWKLTAARVDLGGGRVFYNAQVADEIIRAVFGL